MPGNNLVQHRERSGYTRDFKLLDVFVFNVVGFSLGLALSTNPPFIGAFSPSAVIGWVIMSGALLALANGLVYGWFAGVMPATGGDYVFVSRTLHPALGFLTNWGFTACQLYGLSINLGWIVTVGVAPTLQVFGIVTGDPSLVSFATMLASPWMAMLSTLALIAIYYGIFLSGGAARRGVIYPLFFVAMLGPILMAYIVGTTSHQTFIAYFNQDVAHHSGLADAYENALLLARAAGMGIDEPTSLEASLRGLPLGFLCFLGFTYSVYVGGEVRRADRSQVIGILGALALGTATFAYVMTQYIDMVGRPFNAAMGNPDIPAQLGLLSNSINIPIAMAAPHQTMALVMLFCNLLWFLLIPYVILQVCVHNFVAWSCDRLAPPQFLRRMKSSSAPWFAGLTACLVVAGFVILNYLFGFSLLGAIALAAMAFLITGFAAFVLPSKRPDLVSKLPPMARLELVGVTVFQLMGLLSVVGFGWILYASIFYPEISGGSSVMGLMYLLVVYGVGLIWYQVFQSRNLREAKFHDVDIESLLREIPSD